MANIEVVIVITESSTSYKHIAGFVEALVTSGCRLLSTCIGNCVISGAIASIAQRGSQDVSYIQDHTCVASQVYKADIDKQEDIQ